MSGNSVYRQPQYLGASHEPVHRVRCAVHGFIRYSQSERRVIDHPIFRRLRYIRQLALTELVYPGATHTRFEHSLGVMEMAARIFDRLAAENGAQMEETFAEVDVLREDTMARARQVCRLAALLHDTGHCCFSHAAEPVIHEGSNHEALTVYLLETPELLGRLLETDYFEGCAKLAASLIRPKTAPTPQVQMLRDIVSGQVYQMNTQVYYHRLRRIYDLYLERYFRSFDKAEFGSAEKILSWNDIKALNRLIQDAADRGSPGHVWADRIVNRRHHRDVFSIDEGEGPQAVKTARKVLEAIRKEFDKVEFIEDLPDEPVSIHKIARDDDRDAKLIDFPLLDRGRRTSLGERSQILKNLPTTFRVGFIFADVDDRGSRDVIVARCRALRNENL
jgi:HD superfamily phosphohydrolase